MRFVPDRILWSFYRRHKVGRRVVSFWASIASYCSMDTSFSGYHTIKRGSELYSTKVGRFTYFAENVRVRNCDIGPFCSVGAGVIIGELARHPLDMISTHPLMYSASSVCGLVFSSTRTFEEFSPVTIGADVFIGTRAMIFPGVKLGVGCVIAAGAIVTKDVPPYAIVTGVPAKVIKYRFEADVVRRLVESSWWNWDVDRLRELHSRLGAIPIRSVEQLNSALLGLV
jgi:chloramphenicol O-acetyltransferase type B